MKQVDSWEIDVLNGTFAELAEKNNLKFGHLAWPVRIAVSGLVVTPGGATDIMSILGKEESLRRLHVGIGKIQNH